MSWVKKLTCPAVQHIQMYAVCLALGFVVCSNTASIKCGCGYAVGALPCIGVHGAVFTARGMWSGA